VYHVGLEVTDVLVDDHGGDEPPLHEASVVSDDAGMGGARRASPACAPPRGPGRE
jgi:hypothetical protein